MAQGNGSPFAETINGVIGSSDGEAYRGGSFAQALQAAQQAGVPLLVVLAQKRGAKANAGDDLWAALTHAEVAGLCSGGSVVAWGAWAGSPEAHAVGQRVRALKRAAAAGGDQGAPAGTVALLRPSQEAAGAAALLASFPPRALPKGKKAPKVSARLARDLRQTHDT